MSKYLINGDYRVMMKGKAVSESASAEDFVYDTEGKVLSVAQMKEVAKSNKLKIKGSKEKELKKSFDEALSKLNLSEKKKMTETENVLLLVKKGHEENKSEDSILISIVQSGIKFTQAIKMMKNAAIELGFSINAKDRYAKSKVILEDEDFEPEEYSDVARMAKELVSKIKGTTEAQALQQIRKFAKEFEIDLPKKVKEKKSSVAIRTMAWISLNLSEKPAVMEEWMEEQEFKEKQISSWKEKFEKIQKEAESMKKEAEPMKKGKKGK